MFLWWVVLAHQELAEAHKQKFCKKVTVSEEGGCPVPPAEGLGQTQVDENALTYACFLIFVLYILKICAHTFFFPGTSRRAFF